MLPRITVVTPSYNQGQYIGRTIESVLAQGYPNLEHIVMDAMSTDDTPAVLARYPHLRVIREKDKGQADAVNKGFQLATGDIYAFLNSDDTYLPGALHRAAQEIDPAKGRHIVTGRCIYIDENDTPTGLEHPSGPVSHHRILQVWKAHCIPQPSTFWTAEVWKRCGPMDVTEQLVLDYDLMCRFSMRYRFHFIDQVMATYRLHNSSKSCSNNADEIYAQAIRVSQRYWGSRLLPRYWLLRGSLAEYRFEKKWGRRRIASSLGFRAYGAWTQRSWLRALGCAAASSLLAPEMLPARFLAQVGRRLVGAPPSGNPLEGKVIHPLARVFTGFKGKHADGLVGPTFIESIDVESKHRSLTLRGAAAIGGLPHPRVFEVFIDGKPVAFRHHPEGGAFSLIVSLDSVARGKRELLVRSDRCFYSHQFVGNEDFRPLAFRLLALELSGESVESQPGAAALPLLRKTA